MRALNTKTKNHRASARTQNKSHFCTDMKEQITLLHGYEKARPKSRRDYYRKNKETICQRANGKSQGIRGRRTERTYSCVANANQTQSKAHESRKPSTRSGVYTDVHEQHKENKRCFAKEQTAKVKEDEDGAWSVPILA